MLQQLSRFNHIPSKSYEYDPHIRLAIDAEWIKYLLGLGRGLSFQFAIDKGAKGIIFNQALLNILTEDILERIHAFCVKEELILLFVEFGDGVNLIRHVLDLVDPDGWINTVDLLMFYSPRDLELGFSWDEMCKLYLDGVVTQKRNLKGRFKSCGRDFIIKDLKGWTGGAIKSLKDLMNLVGVNTDVKGSMDKYKADMLEGLKALPEDYVGYGMADTTELPTVFDKFLENIQWLQRDVFELPEDLVMTQDNIPSTTGSVVARTLEGYVKTKVHPDRDAWEFGLKKLGILKEPKTNAREKRAIFNSVIDDVKSVEDFHNLDGLSRQAFDNLKFDFQGYSQTSVLWFGRDTKTTAAFNALVQGGRANNEQPHRYRYKNTLDADYMSAYGAVLCSDSYPIGLPRITAYTPNQTRLTLGEWMAKYENDLEFNLWKVYISGELPFHQDLLSSKDSTQFDINKAILGIGEDDYSGNEDEDIKRIPGQFGVFNRRLTNTIINQRFWDGLKKKATEKELSAILKVEVVTAVYHLKSDRCDTPEEFLDKVLADKGRYDVVDGELRDTRTRAFYSMPLKDIFGKTVSRRAVIKKELGKVKNALEDATDPDEIERLKDLKASLAPKQEFLKLFNNTGYGCIASPFFPIGNTIVADNITGALRLSVYQMSKPLQGIQSITDGVAYEPATVLSIVGSKLPGLESLSNLETLPKHRSIKIVPLGGLDWNKIFDDAVASGRIPDWLRSEKIDAMALDHVNDFWGHYGLKVEFPIEHKYDHMASFTAAMGKAHYAFQFVRPDKYEKTHLYKIRGCKEYRDEDLRKSPMYQLLTNILEGSDEFPEDLEYDHFYLLKVGMFVKAQGSKGYEHLEGKRPGDDVIEKRVMHLNNTHMPLDDVDEYHKRAKRRTYKGSGKNKVNVELFERYRKKGIAYVHKMMMENKLK